MNNEQFNLPFFWGPKMAEHFQTIYIPTTHDVSRNTSQQCCLYEIPTTDLELQNPLGNSTLCLFLPRKTSSSGASWDDDWTSRFSPHIPCTGRVLSVFQLSQGVRNVGVLSSRSSTLGKVGICCFFWGIKMYEQVHKCYQGRPKKSQKRIHIG